MKTCPQCQSDFEITDEDRVFLDRLSPIIGERKHPLPEPTLCPHCRQQRRLSFRNDQHYYRNSCMLCKKSLISIYSPDKSFPVLCNDCFWSDQWDPREYGQDYDFSRSFFEQYAEMRSKVPRLAIFNTQSENAEYTVHSSRNKNCYMSSSIVDCENVHYSDWVFEGKDCMDSLFCHHIELCYEAINSHYCFACEYITLCQNLSESTLCLDCHGGQQLLGCVGLRNQKLHILNKPCTEEAFQETRSRLKTDAAFFEDFQQQYQKLMANSPQRALWNVKDENALGNYLTEAKNTFKAFQTFHTEDTRYVYEVHDVKDSMDCTRVADGELLYECKGIVDLRFSAFCNLCYQSHHMLYSDNCQNSRNSFGCMSLKNNQWCLLNKQYPEEEYKELVGQVIETMQQAGEWGEFFPVSLSAFGYNETKAQEWFPLEKEEVLQRGWSWSDYVAPTPQGIKTIPGNRLPENIQDVPDAVLDWAIRSEESGKIFKIIAQELAFYRSRGVPIPHFTPQERHLKRVQQLQPRELKQAACSQCQKTIMTCAREETEVMCEECYRKEVY